MFFISSEIALNPRIEKKDISDSDKESFESADRERRKPTVSRNGDSANRPIKATSTTPQDGASDIASEDHEQLSSERLPQSFTAPTGDLPKVLLLKEFSATGATERTEFFQIDT